MSETDADNSGLTDAAKASVLSSGLVSVLKQAICDAKPVSDHEMQSLRKDARDMAESIQQMLSNGGLDDATAKKLQALLSRLDGAINGGHISRGALSGILSEAASIIASSDGQANNAENAQLAKTWQKIDAINVEINDDFEKMHKGGVVFDEKLWEKHKELSDYLQSHPHDLAKQKELDATDDKLLQQGEPQLKDHPEAKAWYDDAKQKSDERHKAVDDAQKLVSRNASDISAVDWGSSAPDSNPSAKISDVTMNDVEAPTVTAAADKNSSKNFVRKQTNVCFRTKLTQKLVFILTFKLACP